MLMKTPLPRVLPAQVLPAFVRAAGGVRVEVGRTARGSAPFVVAESGGYRVRFPNAGPASREAARTASQTGIDCPQRRQ